MTSGGRIRGLPRYGFVELLRLTVTLRLSDVSSLDPVSLVFSRDGRHFLALIGRMLPVIIEHGSPRPVDGELVIREGGSSMRMTIIRRNSSVGVTGGLSVLAGLGSVL